MNDDSAQAKKYLDLLTSAEFSWYSDKDSDMGKQHKNKLYLTNLQKILEEAKKESDNERLLTFLEKYYTYLDEIKDQTLRNSYYDLNTIHRNLMLFKLKQDEDAQFFDVELNFDDVWNYFSFASLPDKKMQQFSQQYKERYITGLFISLTTTVCAIAGFIAAACLLAILNPAAILLISFLVGACMVLLPLGVFSAIALMGCAYHIHNINSYQHIANANDKTDQKNKSLCDYSSCFTKRTEYDADWDLACRRKQ